MRIVVLDAHTTDQGCDCWDGLRALGELTVHPRTGTGELAARLAGCEIAITNKTVIDAAALAGAPQLRYIGLLSTGTNAADLAAARARGVAVANVPGYSTESVAQLVFAYLLHWAVPVAGHAAAVRDGRWAAQPEFCFALQPLRELHGRTLAILGSGSIGSAVARIAGGFGMRVLRGQVPGSTSPGRLPLDEILPQADAVSLHCPLTPATTGLVDAAFLARMRPGALLINTGRGGLVDESALQAALASGRLGGAALDVLTQEPPAVNHPLLAADAPWADRLWVTPHLAWMTIESRARLVDEVTANLRAFLAGGRRNRVE
jgi:glycerate dehydrogenase